MPKVISEEDLKDDLQAHVLAVTENVKHAPDLQGGSPGSELKVLYERLNGRAPTKPELQAFYNRLNAKRSNPTTRFLASILNELPSLHDMTVAEFFGINKSQKCERDK